MEPGISANSADVDYFKYRDFFLSSVNVLTRAGLSLLHVLLPIGISFFTFTQIAEPANYRCYPRDIAVGLTIFVIGLAKKVLKADNPADHANFVFEKADSVTPLVAWGNVLAYTLQLYFDFSDTRTW